MVVPSPHVPLLPGCTPLNSQYLASCHSKSAGSDRAIASLPFPLPTYATNILLGGIYIFWDQRSVF